jgi:hypothetical protein
METKTYVITDDCGPYICGKRVKQGQQIRLTDRQAKYELDRGLVRLATDKDLIPGVAPTAPPRPATRAPAPRPTTTISTPVSGRR